ncbi:hypothetical protein LSUE1_G005040 [Lachnellula suecica]|uniref:Uncharacterized protein n=1 Tax=Lachnellula suecica TaxID=602035 RepID=A0A8T9BZV9_9HELO|nr:hypothetical protein LSUE1_G005040 [Lachnellula suecica]
MYIQKNSEALSSKFVAHEGMMSLQVSIEGASATSGKPCTLGFAQFALAMADELQKHIIDEDLKEWVMPDFTTTTEHDKVVASIVFMGSMSKYFFMEGATGCGLPSVTLLGTKEDWERMLQKFDKIPSLGEEPTKWHALLVPVLKRFVETFTSPDSQRQKISGKRSSTTAADPASQITTQAGSQHSHSGAKTDDEEHYATFWDELPSENLCFDGSIYPRIETARLVPGYVDVNVQIDDTYNGNGIYMVKMIAGSVGMEFTASGDHGDGLDTVIPRTGWWAYLEKEDKGKPGYISPLAEEQRDDKDPQAEALVISRRSIWSEMVAGTGTLASLGEITVTA